VKRCAQYFEKKNGKRNVGFLLFEKSIRHYKSQLYLKPDLFSKAMEEIEYGRIDS